MTQEETEKEVKESGKMSRIFLFAVFLLVATSAISIYTRMQPVTYQNTSMVAGIIVYSQIPLAQLQYLQNIALFNNTNKAATTCNFEISAISNKDRAGYMVFIEEGEQGVYIQRNRAYIRGMTDKEILKACNVFCCIKEGIECSPDLWNIRDIILKEKKINIVLDNELSGSAMRGYGDILAALGYIQGEHIMIDLNGDGRIEKWEIEENLIKIFPHIKNGSICSPQPITTSFQKLNATNETFNCDDLSPAIILLKSDENRIDIRGNRIIISGDDEHVDSASIIIRDVISPEFIRSLYRID